MDSINEDLKLWADIVQKADIEKDIEDAEDQTLISTGHEELNEMPMQFDTFDNKAEADSIIDGYQSRTDISKLTQVKDLGSFKIMKNQVQDHYYAYDPNGKLIGYLSGEPHGNVFKVDMTIKASSSTERKVILSIMEAILGEGKKVLSDSIHSPSARSFWERLISSTNHVVYVVLAGEVKAKATPEHMHKYWSTDAQGTGSFIQLLLVS